MNKPTNTSNPLVTLCITCFNAQDTIVRSIRSAQAQHWDNLEILIVDDGSSDDSCAVVAGLAVQDERIRLVKHAQNSGTAVTRSTAMREASGEFLAFLDDDDEAMPERVAEQLKAILACEENQKTDLVACYVSRLVAVPNQPEVYVAAIGAKGRGPHGKVVVDYLLCGEASEEYDFGEMGSGTMMARTATFRKVGDFDPMFRRCAEWDWAVRLAFLGGHFIGCKVPLIRQHITATPDKSNRKPLDYALLLRRKHRAYLLQHGEYMKAILSAYLRFHYARGNRLRFRFFLALLFLASPSSVMRLLKTRSKRKAVEGIA